MKLFDLHVHVYNHGPIIGITRYNYDDKIVNNSSVFHNTFIKFHIKWKPLDHGKRSTRLIDVEKSVPVQFLFHVDLYVKQKYCDKPAEASVM